MYNLIIFLGSIPRNGIADSKGIFFLIWRYFAYLLLWGRIVCVKKFDKLQNAGYILIFHYLTMITISYEFMVLNYIQF